MPWLKDSDRDELAIWVGEFRSECDVEKYAYGKFRRELDLPLDKDFEVYDQLCYYSPRPGDLHSLIGQMYCSASYYDAARAACRGPRAKLYNGGIVVTDHFPEDKKVAKASQVDFLGFFKYDIESDELVSSIRPSYLREDRLSVWCGTFPTKDDFYSYFNLPDFVVDADDFEFWNDFAEDFGIDDYDQETASYNLSRGMRPRPLADLIAEFWVPPSLQERITMAAHQLGLQDGNAIYMPIGLDYDELRAGKKGKPRSRFDFHYVGTFDKPKEASKTAKRKKK